MKPFKKYLDEKTAEAGLRDIVKNKSIQSIRFDDGKSAKIDMTSANMMLKVLDQVKPETAEKIRKMAFASPQGFKKALDLVGRAINKKEEVEITEAKPPFDVSTADYVGASKELTQYAKTKGGMDKDDFLSFANRMAEIGKNKSPKVMAKFARDLGDLDTSPREKIVTVMRNNGIKVNASNRGLQIEDYDLQERVLAKKGNVQVVAKGGVAYAMVNGKQVAAGDFDDGAGGWFMSRKGDKGQKFFDSPQKIADFYKEETEVTESVDIVETIKSIMEDGYSQTSTLDGTDLSHVDVSSEDTLKALNAHVGQIGVREYMNPKGALLQLQQKLATIGLSFEVPALSEETGTTEVELTQFGGHVFGKSVTTPTDEFDNVNPVEGMKLRLEWETLKTGTTKLYAKIV